MCQPCLRHFRSRRFRCDECIEWLWGEFIVSFTHDLSVSNGSNSKVLAFFSKLSSGAGEQLSLGGDWGVCCDPGCNYMVHSFHGDMVEISSENDEFFKVEQVKIDWGHWKKSIFGPKVDTNSALMWLLHGRDAKSKPQHGVSSGSNIAPSQDTASPWHAESRISQDHETNQSPRQSIAVAGVFIAMPSCLDPPEVVGNPWQVVKVQTKVCLRSDSGNVARFYYAHMGHYLSQWSAWTSKKWWPV